MTGLLWVFALSCLTVLVIQLIYFISLTTWLRSSNGHREDSGRTSAAFWEVIVCDVSEFIWSSWTSWDRVCFSILVILLGEFKTFHQLVDELINSRWVVSFHVDVEHFVDAGKNFVTGALCCPVYVLTIAARCSRKRRSKIFIAQLRSTLDCFCFILNGKLLYLSCFSVESSLENFTVHLNSSPLVVQ